MSGERVSWSPPEPFRIHVSDAEVERVHAFCRLADFSGLHANTLEEDTESIDAYGMQPKLFEAIIARLESGYDWREQERRLNNMGEHVTIKLNKFPDEGEFVMHAVVVKSDNPKAMPLLACHGWPGDFFEFDKLSQMLRSRFHIVCPSLPGFVFSQSPRRGGMNPMNLTKVAMACDAVMRAVFGSDNVTYVAQGGDLGSITCRRISQLFPERCRALHLNYASLLPESSQPVTDSMSELEAAGHRRYNEFRATGQAYGRMNKTVPYTLAAMLSTSPLACIAYLGEKHIRWSAPHRRPSLDLVITHCLLYWFTGSLASSFWLYRGRETEGDDPPLGQPTDLNVHKLHVKVPVAFCFGKDDIYYMSRANLEPFFERIESYVIVEGGHFLAQEEPEVLAKDIDAFFSRFSVPPSQPRLTKS